MKIYLAGPMRGKPEHNFPLFNHVAEQLRAEGHEVFNPADLTIAWFGSVDIFEALPVEERNDAIRQQLAEELSWICTQADAVYLLPGWEKSSGATAEEKAARAVGIQVLLVDPKMLLPSIQPDLLRL